MKRHLLCLTLDTDPDGTTSRVSSPHSRSFRGLSYAQEFPAQLDSLKRDLGPAIPVTWFVRVDREIQALFGSELYLLERFADFWAACRKRGDELAWHPHLGWPSDGLPHLIRDSAQACDELECLWHKVRESTLQVTSFRSGEAWHTPETYATVERLGFRCDSTVIPGRQGGGCDPADWTGAPHQPYYPVRHDLCVRGPERPLLEVPLSAWRTQAPYDLQPRIRYINPSVHKNIFSSALSRWREEVLASSAELSVWTLVLHPDEFMPHVEPDPLYAHSMAACCNNLLTMAGCLSQLGHSFEFVTLAEAADRWRLATEHEEAGLPVTNKLHSPLECI